MNASKLKSIVSSIFAFVAVVCSCAYGQSSSLPSGFPAPYLHYTPDSMTSTYYPQYGQFLWKNLAGDYGHALRSYNQTPSVSYDSKGHKYTTEGLSNIGSSWVYNPDVFLVIDEKYSYRSDVNLSIGNYTSIVWRDYLKMNLYNVEYSDPYTRASGLFHIGTREFGTGYNYRTVFAKNGVPLVDTTGGYYAIDINLGIGNVKIYEVLVFSGLTEDQRRQVSNYLMSKYDLKPDIPQNGLTLWVRSDKGVTTDAAGNVTNIKEHSATNATYDAGYGYVGGGNGSMLYWDSNRSEMPQQQGTWYSYRGLSGPFINGKEAEYFAVLYSIDNQYYDREILNFSGKRTLMSWSNPTQIKETFGRRSGESPVEMTDHLLSLNNKTRLYNVSVGGGYWEAYINRTLLRKDNYSLTENMNISSFHFGRSSSDLNPSKGGLYEILVYNRKLTDAEREIIRNYLMVKYNLN